MADLGGWGAGNTGYEVAMLVVTIMIILGGICLGTGMAFRIRWLQDWGRDELFQSLVNGALVGGLVFLFGTGGVISTLMLDAVSEEDVVMKLTTPESRESMCKGMTGMGTGSVVTPACYAVLYLSIIIDALGLMIVAVTSIVLLFGFLSTLAIDAIVVSFTPLAGLSAFVDLFSSLLQFMIMLLTMASVQKLFIGFIDGAALPVMLPIGLVLRTFFMTRRLGGALMAIAIGLAVVFPLTFVLDGRMLTEDLNSASQTLEGSTEDLSEDSTGLLDFNDLFTEPEPGTRVTDIEKLGDKVGQGRDTYESFKGVGDSLANMVKTFIANAIMMIVILPFFNIIITMVSIKELATLLGSEVGGGGLGSL